MRMKINILKILVIWITLIVLPAAYVLSDIIILPPDDGGVIIVPEPGEEPPEEPPEEPVLDPPPPPEPRPEYEIWVTMPDSGITGGKSGKGKKITYKYDIIKLNVEAGDITSASVSMSYRKKINGRGTVDLTDKIQSLISAGIHEALLIVVYDFHTYTREPIVVLTYAGEDPYTYNEYSVEGSVQPRVINARSERTHIQLKISVAGEYSPKDIDKKTVRLTKIGSVELTPVYGILDTADPELAPVTNKNYLIMRFPTEYIKPVLTAGENVEFRFDAIFNDGEPFICAVSARVIDKEGQEYMHADQGGKTAVKDKAFVEIKPYTLPENVMVGITPDISSPSHELNRSDEGKMDYDNRRSAIADQDLETLGGGAKFEPEGLQFLEPARIKLYFSETLPADTNTEDIAIYYWNKALRAWEKLPNCVIDLDETTVETTVAHFSIYQIMHKKPAPVSENPADDPAVSDPGFAFGDVYCYPNPAKRGINPNIHIETLKADSVHIVIYDIAGNEVHSGYLDTPAEIINDRNIYEYVWDISGTASGIYICTIRARRNGFQDLRVIRKLAVIK